MWVIEEGCGLKSQLYYLVDADEMKSIKPKAWIKAHFDLFKGHFCSCSQEALWEGSDAKTLAVWNFFSFTISLEETGLTENPDEKGGQGERRRSQSISPIARHHRLASDHTVFQNSVASLLLFSPIAFPSPAHPPPSFFLFLARTHEINFLGSLLCSRLRNFLLSTLHSMCILLPLCSRPPLAFTAAVLSRYLFPSQGTCIHCLFFIVVDRKSVV